MKKKKISELTSTDQISLADDIILNSSGNTKKLSGIIATKNIMCPANTEIDTGVAAAQMIKVFDGADIHTALYLIGWHAVVKTVLGATLNSHFGLSPEGTEGNLLYRKTNGGNIFIKRNRATSTQYSLIFFK
ncbi:MAG: hypothetical protein PHG18_05385 [Bacilli bacterium]|nr:hypothetical protein [Bacilli bacterium]